MNKILQEIEIFARQNKIPVVLPKTREFLENLCKTHNPKSILEIGMAIGFSASSMLFSCNANITCLEASAPNIVLAKQNFEKLGLTKRVTIIEGDCLKTIPSLNQKFDLIFLDGPKGQYPEIAQMLLPLLSQNGIFVADNVAFRGMVVGKSEITEHRFEKTVKALQNFLYLIKSNNNLEYVFYDELGDGVLVARWRKK